MFKSYFDQWMKSWRQCLWNFLVTASKPIYIYTNAVLIRVTSFEISVKNGRSMPSHCHLYDVSTWSTHVCSVQVDTHSVYLQECKVIIKIHNFVCDESLWSCTTESKLPYDGGKVKLVSNGYWILTGPEPNIFRYNFEILCWFINSIRKFNGIKRLKPHLSLPRSSKVFSVRSSFDERIQFSVIFMWIMFLNKILEQSVPIKMCYNCASRHLPLIINMWVRKECSLSIAIKEQIWKNLFQC